MSNKPSWLEVPTLLEFVILNSQFLVLSVVEVSILNYFKIDFLQYWRTGNDRDRVRL
jgi:hypothetical protein